MIINSWRMTVGSRSSAGESWSLASSPQRLKPRSFFPADGTTEVVPFPIRADGTTEVVPFPIRADGTTEVVPFPIRADSTTEVVPFPIRADSTTEVVPFPIWPMVPYSLLRSMAITSSEVMTPTSLLCSSMTGRVTRLYLSKSSATSLSLVAS